MGRWSQVYLIAVLVVLAAILPSWSGETLGTAGQTEVVQAPPEKAPETRTDREPPKKDQVIAPSFLACFSGSLSDQVRDTFAKLARKIEQPVTIPLYQTGSGYRVDLSETSSYDRNVWGSLFQQVGRRAGVDINADQYQTITLTARISIGNTFLVAIPVSKKVINIRIDARYWDDGTFANLGGSITPQDATRTNLVTAIVPQIMTELQNQSIAAAKAAEEAQAGTSGSKTVASRPANSTELWILGRSRTVPFVVTSNDKIKVLKGKKLVGTLLCNNHYDGKAFFDGEQAVYEAALDPSTTIRKIQR